MIQSLARRISPDLEGNNFGVGPHFRQYHVSGAWRSSVPPLLILCFHQAQELVRMCIVCELNEHTKSTMCRDRPLSATDRAWPKSDTFAFVPLQAGSK